MASVAIVSDSTHYLPRRLVEEHGIREVSLYVGWGEHSERELDMDGFSARTVAILQSLEVPFAAVDILPDPRIRQELSAISEWPTIPQLFHHGELVGGCDIVTEMYESGELEEALSQ